MATPEGCQDRTLDVLVLIVAGAVNTLLAPLVAAYSFGPGPLATGRDIAARALWVAAHTGRWQLGWAFWCVVTAAFAGSFYALSRHLDGSTRWRDLAVRVAMAAAAVDLVGISINVAAVPRAASQYQTLAAASVPIGATGLVRIVSLAHALTDVAAYGLYSLAGLLLLPALFGTAAYPRTIAWLGAAEWSVAGFATALLIVAAAHAGPPLILSIALYGPWVWASALWLARASPPLSSGPTAVG